MLEAQSIILVTQGQVNNNNHVTIKHGFSSKHYTCKGLKRIVGERGKIPILGKDLRVGLTKEAWGDMLKADELGKDN